MKRLWMVRAGLFFGFIFLLWGSLQIGANIGMKAGRSAYHNEYMRQMQRELGVLIEAVDQGDMEEVKMISSRAYALALAAGNDKEFYGILESSEQQITIEEARDQSADVQLLIKPIAGCDIWAEVDIESKINSDWTRESCNLKMPKPVIGRPGIFVGGGQLLLRLPSVENDSYEFTVQDGDLVVNLTKHKKEYLRLRLSTLITSKL